MCVLRLDDDVGRGRRTGRGGGGSERLVREGERVCVLMCVCVCDVCAVCDVCDVYDVCDVCDVCVCVC